MEWWSLCSTRPPPAEVCAAAYSRSWAVPALAGTAISCDASVLQRKQRWAISAYSYHFTCSEILFAM